MRAAKRIGSIALGTELGLDALPEPELRAMAAAAREVAEVDRVLGRTNDNIVGELLRGHGTFYEWDHYPPGDVYDHETHAQYYYHAHPPDQRFSGEHGHFHTFLRPQGMPAGTRPLPLPDLQEDRSGNDALCHLVAIAMTRAGLPFRLFTVNRWVTGESWYAAGDVCRMLERFAIDHARPSWPVNRWITALLVLFRPQIMALVERRDLAVAQRQSSNPGTNVYEDRALEITSYVDIDVATQARAVERALGG